MARGRGGMGAPAVSVAAGTFFLFLHGEGLVDRLLFADHTSLTIICKPRRDHPPI